MSSMTKFIETLLILKIVNNVAIEINPAVKNGQENSNVKQAERQDVGLGVDFKMPDDAVIITGNKLQGSVETGHMMEPNYEDNLAGDTAIDEEHPDSGSDPNSSQLERCETADPYTNTISKASLIWPMGIVKYYIDQTVYDHVIIDRIVESMKLIESLSCILFQPIASSEVVSGAWLHITNPNNERECVHVTPDYYPPDEIVVVIGFNCIRPEEILHTLLHGIGFYDEVTHPHRDQFIRVLWENIQPMYRPLYGIRHTDPSVKLLEYDPSSIMHFHDRAFSSNGGATVAALIPGLTISNKRTLSNLDVMKLKLAFGHACKKRQVDGLIDICKNALPNDKPSGNDDQSLTSDTSKSIADYSDHNDTSYNADESDHAAAYSEKSDEVAERRTKNRFGGRK